MIDLIKQAKAAEKAGKFTDAEKLFRSASRARPNDPKLLVELIEYFCRAPGALPGAFAPLADLLVLQPKSALANRLAAQANYLIGDTKVALAYAKKAVDLAPNDVEAHFVYANILDRFGEVDAALAEVEQVLRLNPDHWHAMRNKAAILLSMGKLEDAAALCRIIHAADPNELTVYNIYARTGTIANDDPMYRDLCDRILPMAVKAGPRHHAAALRVMAKVALDQGDHTAAFGHFAGAKAADPVRPNFPAYHRFVQQQIQGIHKSDFFGVSGSNDERPVFVIGMPRSGSTLLEQILSGHERIGGIGESLMMSQLSRGIGLPDHDGARMVATVKGMSGDQARAVAKEYHQKLDEMQPGKLRVVDKMLHNFERLALIARLFPKAHILHARRDPMDNCVSCYMANLSKWHAYTHNLTAMGQFYRDHIRLMDHWKRTLPNPILEVNYEDVVADTEGKAREIIGFLGLDWDPNCLKFQENENRARTLSAWQVRQPIYTTSVKRWKKYEEFLDPLKAELKEFYPDGF